MNLFSNQEEIFRTEPFSIKEFNLPDSEITLYNGFFDKEQSDELYITLKSGIFWQQDQIKHYGKLLDLPRLTAWYGETDKIYTYSGIQMNPKSWTPELSMIKRKIEEKTTVKFSSVLLNQYRGGNDSVSWHSDDEKELGTNPTIASLSLGESRIFQLRHKHLIEQKQNILLTHGSLLVMGGRTQHYWQHQIPKSSKIMRPRINLTFRVIK